MQVMGEGYGKWVLFLNSVVAGGHAEKGKLEQSPEGGSDGARQSPGVRALLAENTEPKAGSRFSSTPSCDPS